MTKHNNKGLEVREITESYHDSSTLKQDRIAQEVPMAFAYNGQSHAVMMASPLDLDDYALGFSLTERIIDSADDIKGIEIREARQGITIQLSIKNHLTERLQQQRRQLSGRSSCGVCGISDLAAVIPQLTPLSKQEKPSHTVITQAIQRFHQHQTLQQECGAVHCAALFNAQGSLLCLREDIGRHNALDKLIGARIEQNLINDGDFIVMSSRASHELISKTVMAGVNSLITLSAATTLAIDMANQLNVNLIGFVRGDRQIVYTQSQT